MSQSQLHLVSDFALLFWLLIGCTVEKIVFLVVATLQPFCSPGFLTPSSVCMCCVPACFNHYVISFFMNSSDTL